MEKLIDLLNQFEREMYPEDHYEVMYSDGTQIEWGNRELGDGCNGAEKGELYYTYPNTFRNGNEKLLIISKSYGFIGRLVANNKVDCTKARFNTFGPQTDGYEEQTNNVVMRLSIENNPIEFLISILK